MRRNVKYLLLVLSLATPLTSEAQSAASIRSAIRLFDRLTGSAIDLSDARLKQMADHLESKHALEAALIATQDPYFYELTIRHMASPSSNKDGAYDVPLNDFIATLVGIVRDDLDARLLLTGDFRYEGKASLALPAVTRSDNNHYVQLEATPGPLSTKIEKKSPQWPDAPSAGVLTTRAWAESHYSGGTNRRAIQMTFQEFACRNLNQIADTQINDFYVRRDVDRSPGGSYLTYQTRCVGCHAGMDAMSGVVANLDFVNGTFVQHAGTKISAKVNQNSDVFPGGKTVFDTKWENLWTVRHNEKMGWRGPTSGNGIRDFGSMMSESTAFSECMVQRAFKTVCKRAPRSEEKPALQTLSTEFEKDKYNIRDLIANIAVLPGCIL